MEGLLSTGPAPSSFIGNPGLFRMGDSQQFKVQFSCMVVQLYSCTVVVVQLYSYSCKIVQLYSTVAY